MNLSSMVFGSALVAAALMSSAAQAAIMYNNGAPNAVSGTEATAWVQAQDFRFATATTIGGAGIYFGRQASSKAWDGAMDYYIFANSGGQPGAVLASGSGRNVSTSATGVAWCCGGNATLVEFDFATDFLAEAGSTYWFGIHLSTNFDRDNVYWVTTADNSTSLGRMSSGGTFNNWTTSGREHAFFLNGSQNPVPEPSGLALVGVALLGLAAARRPR